MEPLDRRAFSLGAAAIPIGIGRAAHGAEQVDRFIKRLRAESGVVPGLGVAVVHGDETLIARGYGWADADRRIAADADTAFYIASSTKALTGLSFAILASRGELDLDQPLAAFAPDAPFSADCGADRASFRHALTHQSGLSNLPIVWRLAYTGEHDAEMLWRRLADTARSSAAGPGEFRYSNEGYNLATVLTDRKLGRTWQQLIKREIANPAGMTRTTAYASEAGRRSWRVAQPHMTAVPGTLARSKLGKVDATMHSAGGVLMSARDAATWLRLYLNDGRLGRRQVIPRGAIAASTAPMASLDQTFGRYRRLAYGLGWYRGTYRGEALVHAFGSFSGYRSHLSFMPGRRLGVAVFVNDGLLGSAAADAIANYVYDRMVLGDDGGRQGVALAEFASSVANGKAALDRDLANRRSRSWNLDLPLEAYAGTYQSPSFGRLAIGWSDGLTISAGVLNAIAEPFAEPNSARVELAPGVGMVIRLGAEKGRPITATLTGNPLARVIFRREGVAALDSSG